MKKGYQTKRGTLMVRWDERMKRAEAEKNRLYFRRDVITISVDKIARSV